MGIFRIVAGLFLATSLAMGAHAQAYPETNYDGDVPTLPEVVGHEHGGMISSAADITKFLRALADHAPDRMQVRPYGETWQGRELVYAVISSPENMARLESIQADLSTLATGETLAAETLEATPAVVWLSYGVHGDEITPPDSALFMAYHLIAAENDALVDTVLANSIIIIDPSQNPDGRDRFVHSFASALGLKPRADRFAAEHDQPWPRGRYNHYLFDLNRDWFAMTQPETRGKIDAVMQWHPVIYVDSHEMGGDSTYYFPPAARPYNPNITDSQLGRQTQLGRNMASWFDRFGVDYFTREVFDAFYPGYGDMWPTLNGAIAMTFEQASPRGLIFARSDGTLLTYAEGVRNNVLTSLATLEIVARNKNAFLTDYAEFRRTAIDEASGASDRYIVLNLASSRYEAEAMGRRLAQQGIAVQRVPAGSEQCRVSYPDGALIIDMAQPQGRLIKTLLSQSTPLAPEFIAEQESRRERGLNHELYDVTAWSLPLMDGVDRVQCRRVDLSAATPVSATDPIPAITSGTGQYGYVVPWTDGGQARLVIAALKAGLQGKTTDRAFVQNGRTFPSGSVVFSIADNSSELGRDLTALSQKIGAEIVPMANSWVEDGPNFGSSAFAALSMPEVAIAWGNGTSPTSAGNSRFVLEHQLGVPVTPIRVSALAHADLSAYDVLIIPDTYGGLVAQMGSAEPLKEFVKEGGVLIAFSTGVSEIAAKEVGLLSTQLELATSDGAAADESDNGRVPGINFASLAEYEEHIHDHRARPEDIPGVLVKTIADPDHWLAAGYTEATALVTGREIYRPLNESDGTNVFRFADAETLLESGYLWEENRAQLAFKPFVMAERQGNGVVIGFTQSPTTRAYLNGLNMLLANAVILGPARVAQ
ncbi:MAG: M14 family zinc carboxypeptidase [Henriciella sp.]